MKENTATEEPIISYYKWNTLQPKMQQYLIDYEQAAQDIVTEVISQCR